MNRYTILLLIILSANLFAVKPPASKAQGIFFAAGVGPRLPIGSFSNTTDLGYGVNLDVSYTDSDYLPFFFFARIGFEQYPGSQSFYRETEYSNFQTQLIPIGIGIRYYFSPLLESIVLLIPVAEFSVSYTYMKKLHEFKMDSGRNNFTEELMQFGASAGVGVSMFMLEVMAHYNYYEGNQNVSINLNVRLPLFINL